LRDIAAGRQAAVIIIFAAALVPLLLAAGGAIDIGRFYVTKSRVQYALDAALLAAGATDPTEDRQVIFDAYFKQNFPASEPGDTVMITQPNFTDPTASTFTASVNLKVPTVFLYLAAINELETTIDATVVRVTTGLELALVIDSTGSMLRSAQAGGGGTKLDDLKTAAGLLLDVVFAGEATSPDVKVAIVPYVTAVNIGTDNAPYVVNPTPPHDYPDESDPKNFDTKPKGCVLARKGGNDVLDTYSPGSANAGKWEPYFWEAESFYNINGSEIPALVVSI